MALTQESVFTQESVLIIQNESDDYDIVWVFRADFPYGYIGDEEIQWRAPPGFQLPRPACVMAGLSRKEIDELWKEQLKPPKSLQFRPDGMRDWCQKSLDGNAMGFLFYRKFARQNLRHNTRIEGGEFGTKTNPQVHRYKTVYDFDLFPKQDSSGEGGLQSFYPEMHDMLQMSLGSYSETHGQLKPYIILDPHGGFRGLGLIERNLLHSEQFFSAKKMWEGKAPFAPFVGMRISGSCQGRDALEVRWQDVHKSMRVAAREVGLSPRTIARNISYRVSVSLHQVTMDDNDGIVLEIPDTQNPPKGRGHLTQIMYKLVGDQLIHDDSIEQLTEMLRDLLNMCIDRNNHPVGDGKNTITQS